jgi:hypothetical protein
VRPSQVFRNATLDRKVLEATRTRLVPIACHSVPLTVSTLTLSFQDHWKANAVMQESCYFDSILSKNAESSASFTAGFPRGDGRSYDACCISSPHIMKTVARTMKLGRRSRFVLGPAIMSNPCLAPLHTLMEGHSNCNCTANNRQ